MYFNRHRVVLQQAPSCTSTGTELYSDGHRVVLQQAPSCTPTGTEFCTPTLRHRVVLRREPRCCTLPSTKFGQVALRQHSSTTSRTVPTVMKTRIYRLKTRAAGSNRGLGTRLLPETTQQLLTLIIQLSTTSLLNAYTDDQSKTKR